MGQFLCHLAIFHFPKIFCSTFHYIVLEPIDALPILHQLFTTIITTTEIAEEYGKPLPDWVTILSVKDKKTQNELSPIVDYGEASAIALAHEIENNFPITDDLHARKLALKLGLSIIGTLSLLLRAKQKGLIDLLAPYLQQIKQTNFRMSLSLMNTILKEASEI